MFGLFNKTNSTIKTLHSIIEQKNSKIEELVLQITDLEQQLEDAKQEVTDYKEEVSLEINDAYKTVQHLYTYASDTEERLAEIVSMLEG